MTLQDLIDGRNVEEQKTSRSEVQELPRVAARSLADANAVMLSPEGRFALAYDAVLELSTIPLRCAGYRTRGEGHHWSVFDALPDIMGDEVTEIAGYFQKCRSKRNTAVYRRAAVVSRAEANELHAEAEGFDQRVRKWLKDNYPQYA